MTNDTISRAAAIAEFSCCELTPDGGIDANYAIDFLKQLPSVQPERKTGKWIKMSDADGVYWSCSECGEDLPRVSHYNPQFDLFPRLESIEKTNFCPNCGIDMRGDHRDGNNNR